MRTRTELAFVSPLKTSLDALRDLLQAEKITEESIPPGFAGNWIKPDGRARVQVYPKGDPDDNEVLRQFARAVLAVEPTASGGPFSILEWGGFAHPKASGQHPVHDTLSAAPEAATSTL